MTVRVKIYSYFQMKGAQLEAERCMKAAAMGPIHNQSRAYIVERRGEDGGRERVHLLFSLVSQPLLTHPSRDGALLLLLSGHLGR